MSAVAGLSAAAVYAFRPASDERVAVPVPGARAAAYCAALHAQLPAKLDGLSEHDLKPVSDLTAGWGDPLIVLRCGVPRPAVDADPQTVAVEVNGVTWSYEQVTNGGVRMTTTLRKAYVEVLLPPKYAHDTGPLVDLAKPVEHTIPEGV